MSQEENPGKNSRSREFWQPIQVYNTLKSWFFKVFPKDSPSYRVIRNSLSIVLKQLNIINLYYHKWIQLYDSPTQQDIARIHKLIEERNLTSPLSILMPVYNPPVKLLREAIESVINQVYPHWELCIADDASTDPRIPALLHSYAAKDNRIKVIIRKENGHISAASNSALSLASHDYVVLLDHDDILHPFALFEVARAVQEHPDSVIIYSDEDKITKKGKRLDPYFKPDFDYELLLSQNMISHLGVYRTDIAREVGGFRIGLEGSQDYDLALRVMDRCKPNQILHIPHPLYHWRLFKHSAARGLDVKPYTVDAAVKALQDHLARRSVDADVHFLPDLSSYSVSYHLPEKKPTVGLLLFADELSPGITRCVESIMSATDYQPYHLYLNLKVAKGDHPLLPDAWQEHVSLLPADHEGLSIFGLRANGCIHKINADIIGIMPGSLTGFSPGWLSRLIGQLLQDNVGAVAPRLLREDGRVYSNGLILLPNGSVAHLSQGKEQTDNGYFGWSKISRGYSVLPTECVLFHKVKFNHENGFSEKLHTPLGCLIDLCLKFRKSERRNILLPEIELIVNEKNNYDTRAWGVDVTQEIKSYIFPHWESWFNRDPSFNPNLTIIDEGQIVVNLTSEKETIKD